MSKKPCGCEELRAKAKRLEAAQSLGRRFIVAAHSKAPDNEWPDRLIIERQDGTQRGYFLAEDGNERERQI